MRYFLLIILIILLSGIPGYAAPASLSKLELGEMKDGKWAEIKQSNFNPAWAYIYPPDMYFRENGTTVFKGVRKGWWLDLSQLAVEKELSEKLAQKKQSAFHLREYENKIFNANIFNWISGAALLYGVLSYDYSGAVIGNSDAITKNKQITNLYLGAILLGMVITPLYGGTAFDDLFKSVDSYNNPSL